MIVTFTLNSAYTGATYEAGPFNISGTTNLNVTTELAAGISKSEMITGYTINNVDDSITGGTIQSTGTCTNTQPWSTGVTPPTAYSFIVKLGITTPGICELGDETVYSDSSTITTGTALYFSSDISPASAISGYNYVYNPLDDVIWNLFESGNIVAASTETGCNF